MDGGFADFETMARFDVLVDSGGPRALRRGLGRTIEQLGYSQ